MTEDSLARAGGARRLGLAPRLAAGGLVAAALVVSLAGVLHMNKNKPSPFIAWVAEARPVIEQLSEIESNAIQVGQGGTEGVEYSIDCATARPLVDGVQAKMPPAPDRALGDLVERLFTTTKARYDACVAGDMTKASELAQEALEITEQVRQYTLRKTGGDHSH